ncbi:hypothetical protein J4423_02580 [Candidatus Pacearchaeota archaeon]|nr:hypothetical protein [Candidatus Pacearchaeota archaeon]
MSSYKRLENYFKGEVLNCFSNELSHRLNEDDSAVNNFRSYMIGFLDRALTNRKEGEGIYFTPQDLVAVDLLEIVGLIEKRVDGMSTHYVLTKKAIDLMD